MIPYFQLNSFLVGPLTIQVWGLFVSLGILVALFLSYRLSNKYFLSYQLILDVAVWVLVLALIFARVFHIVFYDLSYYLTDPIEIFKFWRGGASSLGGFFGAGLAVWIFAKARKLTWKNLLPYFDMMAVSLWLGWGIGRLGCFFIHDHPGRLSNFILAVNFPGGARHDLGLYESLLAFVLFAIFFIFFERLVRRGWGWVFGLSAGVYAMARFLLDFLRARDLENADTRYLALTPAQWGMVAVIVTLTFVLFRSKMGKRE